MLAIDLTTGDQHSLTGLGLVELQHQPVSIALIFSVLVLDFQTPEQGPVIPRPAWLGPSARLALRCFTVGVFLTGAQRSEVLGDGEKACFHSGEH